MGGGSFAAVIDAIRRQRAAERQMRAMVRGIKDRRARRRRLGGKRHRPPPREPFPCFHLCARCKHLQEQPGECERCGEGTTWDLAEWAVSLRLRDLEDAERAVVPRQVKVILGATLLVAPVIVVIAVVVDSCLGTGPRYEGLLGPSGLGLGLGAAVLAAALAASTAAYFALQRLASRLWFTLVPNGPGRSRHPVPAPPRKGHTGRVVTGVVSGEPTLTAPFTGRPCVAWRVGVLFDRATDARPPEWLLDESCAVDGKVGDDSFDGARTTVVAQPLLLAAHEVTVDDEAMDRFLRARGLMVDDIMAGGEAELFEAIVAPGDQGVLFVPPGGAPWGPMLESLVSETL